eukprot:CAMPEP_0174351592 /NCGR_PEP_ID=MMETSP0811_2-20130205/9005_1 /TAXON_ID=73025 ORGANISM="Eutreptiella gymnastica-like, Strain CCMP1594" /NCGR_SAMPLE_ID=MMETSP0811_2 /ASSEMBLY_ACC=CAM_ASM_000667 /LENGTH=87 /DNA_ID=CAMNT_0015480977 /DNA_START=393 /DNA_END=652 /DNA_ORIENTATION=-
MPRPPSLATPLQTRVFHARPSGPSPPEPPPHGKGTGCSRGPKPCLDRGSGAAPPHAIPGGTPALNFIAVPSASAPAPSLGGRHPPPP